MAGMNKDELDRAIREVIKRSVVDPEFRAKALTDSNAAVQTIAKKPLPEGTSIRFVQNYGKSTRTFTLPDPVPENEQLLEQDLEQVAGGLLVDECGSSCGSNSCLNT
jgi:hypothetical protein